MSETFIFNVLQALTIINRFARQTFLVPWQSFDYIIYYIKVKDVFPDYARGLFKCSMNFQSEFCYQLKI